MPLLPQPDTVSPGSLIVLYVTGSLDHATSANFLAGVDVTDVGTIRAVAEDFAVAIQGILTNISYIHGWRIADPSGVSLYEEEFPAVYTGTRGPSGEEVAMQSATGALTGKGLPDVGLAQGQTRTTLFLGSFDPSAWPDAREGLATGPIDWTDLKAFLAASDVVGADHYGSKATYRNYWTPQINSHYQKRYGL